MINRKYPVNIYSKEKKEASREFRIKIIYHYLKWFNGEIEDLYGEKKPLDTEKIQLGNPLENAIMTWGKLHQEQKYQHVLRLPKGVFSGMKILDLGSGPYPSAVTFDDCEIYCLDPLVNWFKKIGYPYHLYENRVNFIGGYAETIPFKNNTFDAIISVNAIDHFDDLISTSKEIQRVLRNNGILVLHIHYHNKTILESLELDDNIIKNSFSWCEGFNCVLHEKEDYKSGIADGYYALWSNFHAL